jgi:GT2 family glycosyltransferase
MRPKFSIILPTYNRPGPLSDCLKAICALETPRETFELIVVDDHGESPAQAVVEPFRDHLNFTVVRQPGNGGPAKARNRGAELARGQFLCFTDDDCALAPDWLNVIERRFRQDENVILGGHVINALPANDYSSASQVLIDYLYQRLLTDSGEMMFFTSNNLAIPARLFAEIGGFDESFGRAASEDREICHRLRNSGHALVYEPDARVYHAHDMGFGSYWRQHFWYGAGALQFRRRLKDKQQSAPQIEPFHFYADMLSFPFSQMKTAPALRISALLLLSQFAHTAGFFWEAARAK